MNVDAKVVGNRVQKHKLDRGYPIVGSLKLVTAIFLYFLLLFILSPYLWATFGLHLLCNALASHIFLLLQHFSNYKLFISIYCTLLALSLCLLT